MLSALSPSGLLPLGAARGVAAPVNPLVTGLQAFWKLNETSGSRADSIGTYTLLDVGTNGTPSEAGKISNAASFLIANQNRLMSAQPIPVASGEGWTLAGWLKPGAVIHNTWFCNGGLLFQGVDCIQATDAGVAPNWFQIYCMNAAGELIGTSNALNAGAYNFIRAWYDPADRKVRLSINNGSTGVSTQALSAAFSLPGGTGRGAGFGKGIVGDAPWMGGAWDEVGFWTRVLTTQEGTTLYNSGNATTLP